MGRTRLNVDHDLDRFESVRTHEGATLAKNSRNDVYTPTLASYSYSSYILKFTRHILYVDIRIDSANWFRHHSLLWMMIRTRLLLAKLIYLVYVGGTNTLRKLANHYSFFGNSDANGLKI